MTRIQISAFLALSVLFWLSLLAIRGVALSWEILLPFGAVVSAVSVVMLVFDVWAWKLPLVRGFLIKRPVLYGTWKTELQSDWIDPDTNEGIPTIHCYTVIRQTASTLSIRLVTPESRSETVSAGIEGCGDGTFEINCSYRNKPRSMFRYRSEVHYGALLLTAENLTPNRLDGEYWTDRKTRGSLVLTDRLDNTCMSFDEADRMFRNLQ